MPIAALPSDAQAIAEGYVGRACQRRREVLRETLAAFEADAGVARYSALAERNLAAWRPAKPASPGALQVFVVPDDWGEVARHMTTRFGRRFAVLNMANAAFPGGGYGEGAAAQEENMFRRTDCHFHVAADHLRSDGRRYRQDISDLLQGRHGRVYLDTVHPRVCIRGPEDRGREDLGYRWLADDEVFAFHELRASAQDLRDGAPFDPAVARRTVCALLDTLCRAQIRHVVLGAFGCGAFENPASAVAAIFREALSSRASSFDVVAFAIFNAGYGPDNYTPFAREFGTAT